MTSEASSNHRSVPSLAAPPPAGAMLASFVLFASLAALLAVLYAGAEWWNLAGGFGFPSDAAWVRVVLARNLASGRGLCFNPGVAVGGAAGPAWVICLGGVGFLTGKFMFAAKAAGVICVILTCFLTWRVTLNLLGDWRFAFIAALLVASSPRFASEALSGTESALAALVLLAATHWQAEGWEGAVRQRALTAAAAGMAALSRPELILLLPLLLADRTLVALVREKAGRRLRSAVAMSVPEVAGAGLVLVPYLFYNWRVGGPLWQQPEAALHARPALAWAGSVGAQLWRDNPLLLCAAGIGLPVAALAAGRARSGYHSFLPALAPLALLALPGLLWRRADGTNADYAAAYLTPLVAILGAAGLFLVHRAVTDVLSRRERAGRIALGVGIGAAMVILFGFTASAHQASWLDYGFRVKKVSGLQGYIGQWAADHLAPDASIASREVGAIGFFSRRRVVDLGGTIDPDGREYLSRPGQPDSNLLEYLPKAQPSHLAIRPSDFPYLSRRADLLTPAVTCVVTDPFSGGATTMVLYQTQWPPPSMRAARENSTRR